MLTRTPGRILVNWCGHGQEFIPWPEADAIGRWCLSLKRWRTGYEPTFPRNAPTRWADAGGVAIDVERVLVGRAGWLLDDLIRPPQQRRRDRQAEGLGGLEVDDQLELRGLLDGKLARLFALQDPVHIRGGARLESRGE